jgi:hypothetical protein
MSAIRADRRSNPRFMAKAPMVSIMGSIALEIRRLLAPA